MPLVGSHPPPSPLTFTPHPHPQAKVKFPAEAGVFIDFMSLCQKDAQGNRTDAEMAAFGAALSSMQIWYEHAFPTFAFSTLPAPSRPLRSPS